jgi:5-(carboxyamino)imidazole ribonucleotide synthase
MTDALPSNAVIGILGGGQLGRMLSLAAARLGYRCHIFEPAANPPASQVSDRTTTAGYDNDAALIEFAKSVDVVTYEFENIPAKALETILDQVAIRPGIKALEISQDRIVEKQFLQSLGLEVAPYAAVSSEAELLDAVNDIGTPTILKTCRLGYDGKGQARLSSIDDVSSSWALMNGAPSVVEGFINFSQEISVIGARSADGQISCFDPGRNVHRNGILYTTTVPASIPASLRTDAVLIAAKILNALEYVGVLGVELFVTPSGLLVNEIAPRVHNSGHWTQNGCAIDQFEQHIRAVAGLPLGDGVRHSDIEMTNLIGNDVDTVSGLLTDGKCALHLYGKAETRTGRKMGHVNRITGSASAG